MARRRVRPVVGSTNHSWRGFYVQNNNAIILKGKNAVKLCMKAFDDYWANDNVKGFSGSASAVGTTLNCQASTRRLIFAALEKNAVLKSIGEDVARTTSSLFFLWPSCTRHQWPNSRCD